MGKTEEGSSKTLLIAGAAPGFGEAVATRFMAAGYRVAGLARSTDWGTGFETTGQYRHFRCDLADEVSVSTAVEAISDEMGAPTVVVYNAMAIRIIPFQDLSVEDFTVAWQAGCLGAMILSKQVLPHMVKEGQGCIIFSGATASIRGGAKFASFASAKFAMRGLAQALAREYGSQGIHVVHALLDGLIWGPQTLERIGAEKTKCMDPGAIADTYLHLVGQDQSVWTHELDMRPWHERF